MIDVETGRAILLGVVQGITEFLPISSDGHLALMQLGLDRWFGKTGDGNTLELVLALHVGTLISIIAVFWKDLVKLPRQPWLCGLLILATIPAGIVGLLLKDTFEQAFNSPFIAGLGFIVTAAALLAGQWFERPRIQEQQLSMLQAFWIGCCQTFALLPGVSRSGTTIAAGLSTGLERSASARFSFLMAVPVIGGATLLMVKDVIKVGHTSHSLTALVVGATTAGLVGYFALSWLLRMVTQRRLHYFAYYCLVLGIATIVWSSACPANSTPAITQAASL
ncbi:MAG: uppP [Planctomycetaceae bacterium]|nr:uppP [Planctomycetaceae bacterium]